MSNERRDEGGWAGGTFWALVVSALIVGFVLVAAYVVQRGAGM